MDALLNVIAVIGIGSLGLLWGFSVMGGIHILWSAFGDHAGAIADKLKR
jgi:hypothetical protein